jgi:hypothetical protein
MLLIRAGVVVSGLWLLLAQGLWAQARPFKSYKTHEDYCQDNPKASTCIKMKPLNLDALGTAAKRPAAGRVVTPAAPKSANPTMILLGEADWRFAHTRPDMLAGLNISGLVKSPFVQTLLKEIATGGGIGVSDLTSALASAGDLEKVCVSLQGKDILMLLTGRPEGFEAF